MEELIQKYRSGQLTPDEYRALCAYVEQSSDEELMQVLSHDQGEENAGTDQQIFTAADIRRIKRSLGRRLSAASGRRPRTAAIYRILSRAAVLLLPVLLCTTLFFYHSYASRTSEMVYVTTEKGERASVTLPDGTVVKLNAQSELSYRASDFTTSCRQVNFTGEAYFKVAKQSGSTFSVNGNSYTITVLGTAFNLYSYNHSPEVVVALNEGSVSLTSVPDGGSVVMQAGDVSTLNRLTHEITTTHPASLREATAWQSGELLLRHVPLSVLLQRLSDVYGVSIDVHTVTDTTNTFTGVLPTGNLNEALDIVEQLYHVQCTADGSRVVVGE